MSTSSEILAVNLDHAQANRDSFLKQIFDEYIIAYGRDSSINKNTYAELIALTSFYAEAKGLRGIVEGFEYLKNLTILKLSANDLTSIGRLSGLNKLVTLELAYNQLQDIGTLYYCKSLVTCIVNNNLLYSIGRFDNTATLVTLEAQINNLTSVGNLSGNTNLATLNLSANLFESLPASYIPFNNLVTLNLESNRIPTSGVGGIDAILAACATGRSTYGKLTTVKLAGSYMGVPTGGDANASVVALRGAGVTVEIRTS